MIEPTVEKHLSYALKDGIVQPSCARGKDNCRGQHHKPSERHTDAAWCVHLCLGDKQHTVGDETGNAELTR